VNSTWPEYVQLDTGGSFTRGDSTNEPIAESKDADDYLGPIVVGGVLVVFALAVIALGTIVTGVILLIKPLIQ
jgi:hypothetical protein